MGWNSTVVVMNDALGYIEEDPEFGTKLARAISKLMVLDWRAIMEGRMTKKEAYAALKQKDAEMIEAGKKKIAERKQAERSKKS